jgi:hypothetical protein
MQPYFFPYIGYFQLMNIVDQFVIYDNIQYIKKGWINRNRILLNGSDLLFSLPLKKDSDYLDVNKRYLADNYDEFKKKFKGQLISAYSKSPEFKQVFPVVEQCLDCTDVNLFDFIFNSIRLLCSYMEINTTFILSSSLGINHSLKSEQKVIAINQYIQSNLYVNAIGGLSLYSKENFDEHKIDLKFIQTAPITYKQFNNTFVSNLSIIDVLMFNRKEQVRNFLNSYTLI